MSRYRSSAAQERADQKYQRSWRLAAAFSRGRRYPRTPPLETGTLIVAECLNSEIHVEGRRSPLTE
jgi:hypothetical protein